MSGPAVPLDPWSPFVAFGMPPGGADGVDEALRRRLADALRRLERGEHEVLDEARQPAQLVRAALGYAKIGGTQTQDAIARIYLTVLMD